MELDKQIRYTDVKSQYKDHNTGIKGFNDRLDQTFMENIWKDPPPLDKWEALKNLMDAYMSWNVNYSFERPVERDMMYKVRQWMTELEERERKEKIANALETVNELHGDTLKRLSKDEGFYFTGVPDFDQKAWEKMLKNLEGLS